MRRCLIAFLALPFAALQGTTKPLLEEAILKPSCAEVMATRRGSAVEVAIAAGKDDFPGVAFVPPGGRWDLSKFGHLEARVVNTGKSPLTLALRVDNAGDWRDNPWNTETLALQPGERGTLKTIFGYQYGYKKGFALDPAKVVNVLLFTTKVSGPQAFRVESLTAGGPAHEKPPVAPEDVRITPKEGRLLEKGATNLRLQNGARLLGSAGPFANVVDFPSPTSVARLVPSVGRWDLRESNQVRVTVQNAGATPVEPRVRLETNDGDSDWASLGRTLPHGARADILLPFGHPIDLDKPETLKGVTSDAVRAVAVTLSNGSGHLSILAANVESPAAQLPTWLGQRPPVSGEWTKTLDDNFDGTRLDPMVWKATGENYYDKTTHWSKDNVIVKDSFARLRYEKKRGFQNDDPKRNETAYGSGYLDTFGLWAQRYGYFEARVKVPRAPGLWPAFWMMPDRGSKGGPEQWKRQFTGDGAMEFDILESLTRWGPHRTNIAMHYDGYEKEHRALGSDKIYFETDKDGFVTCGLLWLPGEAVYYYNGKEVLRWKNPRISNVPSILMFTLPSGGWDNDAVDDTRLPADFTIDYVRVWQRKDLASPTDGRRHDPQN